MAAKFLIAAAVPFHTARLQANLNRNNVVRKMKGMEKNEIIPRDTTDSGGSSRRMHTVTTDEIMRFRYVRNWTRVQTFQEKAKKQEKLLKQYVSHLKSEKMKLLLKNEALRIKNNTLEVENQCLKLKVLDLQHLSLDKGNNLELVIKQALFIDMFLQKEWILPKIFIFLVMSIWESVKQNVWWTPYVSMHLSLSSSPEYLLKLACLPWRLMIPMSGYHSNSLIING